jgi:CBS domain containing-hemolysin-like protein
LTPSGEALFILVLLVLSGCFSAMETALVSLGDVKARRLVEDNPRPPKMLRLWREQPNAILATILIGNNVVNITISALATDLTETLLFGTTIAGWGIPIAVGVTTMFVLVAGEVVPKTYAKHNPERVLFTLPILAATYFLFYPLMKVLVSLTSGVVKRMGGSTEGSNSVTEDDIEEMVRIGKSDGSMSPVSAKLLTGIFELDDKVAREVMVPRTDLRALPAEAGLTEIINAVKEHGHSRFPVYEGSTDNIIGVLYVKDYMLAALTRDRNSPPKAKDVVRRPLVRPWNIGVQDLFHDMQRERVHMAIIASEYGGVAGIVCLEDIVEEVFGPIYDEHDRLKEAIRKQPDGSWIVDGVVAMSELENELETDFPDDEEDDYETVAGLLMQEAGRVPEPGFVCEYHGFRFEVLHADPMQVREVAVRKVEPQTVEEAAAAAAG